MNNSAKPIILVVDDDRLVLATLTKGLKQAGFDVIKAESGEQAVEICELQTPDLGLFDVRMPGISGIEAARRIRQYKSMPYMILTAYSDEYLVDEAVQEGALGYLVKPLDVAQIVPSIRSALKTSQGLQQLEDTAENMSAALKQGRETSAAVGILMERHHLLHDQAFAMLRNMARSRRRKISVVANEILSATETLNSVSSPLND